MTSFYIQPFKWVPKNLAGRSEALQQSFQVESAINHDPLNMARFLCTEELNED